MTISGIFSSAIILALVAGVVYSVAKRGIKVLIFLIFAGVIAYWTIIGLCEALGSISYFTIGLLVVGLIAWVVQRLIRI